MKWPIFRMRVIYEISETMALSEKVGLEASLWIAFFAFNRNLYFVDWSKEVDHILFFNSTHVKGGAAKLFYQNFKNKKKRLI